MTGAIRERALALGVELGYHGIDGRYHEAGDEVLTRVVAVLESDRATAAPQQALVEPVHLAAAGVLRVARRATSASITVGGAQRSLDVCRAGGTDTVVLPDDLPLGFHTVEVHCGDLVGQSLVVVAPPTMPRNPRLAGCSGLFVPTYALWEGDAGLPSFRLLADLARALPPLGVGVLATLPLHPAFLDEPYDPSPYSPISRLHWNELYIDDDALPPAAVPPQTELVDWRALATRRRHQLVDAARAADAALLAELDRFTDTHPDVVDYARFRAGHDGDPSATGETVRLSYVLGQYLAHVQLGAVRGAPGEVAALALDLPVGSHPSGYEAWAHPELFADGMSIGAPPDGFFTEGQNWAFPPQLPAAMRASGHRLWRQLIERAGAHADVLRIDHAMAVHRLWWIPDGFPADQGVYVRYPSEEILAVIATTAAAVGVTIVGEDLGTVPTEVSEAFDRWDVLGMYEEQFHLDVAPLPHIPARTVAGVRTHDMAAFAEVVATADLRGYEQRLSDAHGCEVSDGNVLDEMLRRLAASDAYLVMADLDDLVGEIRPHNLPGRVVPGLWQRRLRRPTSETLSDGRVRERLALLARRR